MSARYNRALQAAMTLDRFSLRWRLPLLFAAVATLSISTFGVLAYRAARTSTLDAADARLRSTLTQLGTIAELGAVQLLSTMRSVSADPAVINSLTTPVATLPPAAIDALKQLQTGPGSAEAVIELFGADGRLRWILPAGGATRDDDGVMAPLDATIGPLHRGHGALSFQSSAPVLHGQRVAGTLRVTRRLGRNGANSKIVTALLGPEAVLLVGNQDRTLFTDDARIVYPAEPGERTRYVRDGRAWISEAAPVRGTPWMYSVEIPETAALAPAHALIGPFTMTGLVIAILCGVFGWHLCDRIVKPLTELTSAADAIAHGDRDVHLTPTDRGDEVGQLARSFGSMAASVRSELRRSETFAALGRLSGTVGHELRNPLGVMSNVVFLLDSMPDASPKVKTYAALLRDQLRLSDRIISDLLGRARSSAPVLSSVDVGQLLNEHIERLAPESVIVRREFGAVPWLGIDRDRVGQIVWNLLTNAIQAMDGQGILTVRTRFTDDRLVVEIADSGPGVADAEIDKIFDPLYTTKPHGVGLGLPISRALARANGGDLSVRVEPGGGACFRLELPAAPLPAGTAVVSH